MTTIPKDFNDLILSSYLFVETYPLEKYREAVKSNFNVIEERDKSLRFNSPIEVQKRISAVNFQKLLFEATIKSDFHTAQIRHTIQFLYNENAEEYLDFGILQHAGFYALIANSIDDIYFNQRRAYYITEELNVRVECVNNLVIITHRLGK
jgi:hypothetical protein